MLSTYLSARYTNFIDKWDSMLSWTTCIEVEYLGPIMVKGNEKPPFLFF